MAMQGVHSSLSRTDYVALTEQSVAHTNKEVDTAHSELGTPYCSSARGTFLKSERPLGPFPCHRYTSRQFRQFQNTSGKTADHHA